MKTRITYLFVLCFLLKAGTAQIYFNNRYDNFNSCDGYGTISNYQGMYLGTGNVCTSVSFFCLNMGKFDYNGALLNSKTYIRQGSNFQSTFSKNIFMPNTDFIVGGTRFYRTDTSLVFLWRFNSNLDSIKYSEYGYLNKTNFIAAIERSGKYIYMVGSTDSLYKNTQILLIKTDTSGTEIWKKKIGLPGWDETAWCIKISSDDKLLISGNKRLHNNQATNGAYILKVDTNGTVLWEQYFSSNKGLAATGLIELPNTDIVAIAGKGYGNATRMELIKLDASGNLIFDKTYGPLNDHAEPYSMIMNGNGNLVAVGQNYYPSMGGMVNGLMYEFNQNGDSLFSREYNVESGSQNYFRDLVQAPDKGYVFSGFITPVFPNGGTGTQDIWLLKTDSTFCESNTSCGYPTGLMALNKTEGNILVYPNPAQNEITFTFENNPDQNAVIVITDVLGNSVAEYTVELRDHKAKIDVSNLPAGMFYYEIDLNTKIIKGKIAISR